MSINQRFETHALNGGVVYEYVLAAVLRANKTETLAVVKPLYRSCNHGNTSVWLNYCLVELWWFAAGKIDPDTTEYNIIAKLWDAILNQIKKMFGKNMSSARV